MLDKRDINNHRARSIIAYVSAAIVLVALIVLMGTIGKEKRAEEIGQQTRDTPHKSDKDMIDNFLSHRSEFEKLLTMVMEDKSLYRVDYDWSAPEHPESAGISASRIDEYRKFMEKLGLLRGFSATRAKGYIEFFATSFRGSMKGYFYCEEPPEELDDNLDDVIKKDLYYGYRHIEGNWYLFYKRD